MAVAATATQLLEGLIKCLDTFDTIVKTSLNAQPPLTLVEDRAADSVVVVEYNGSWATAILISTHGYLLTVKHLFPETAMKTDGEVYVRVGFPKLKKWERARLIYLSPSVIDVALVKMEKSPEWLPLPVQVLPSELYKEGAAVVSIGYPVLSPELYMKIGPHLSCGRLSKIVQLNGQPIMLQTSAVVSPGNSGGLLIDRDSGKMIGMITCNTKVKDKERIHKRLNFGVPASLLAPLWEYSEQEERRGLLTIQEKNSLLSSFNIPNDSPISRIWQMQISPQNLPHQHLQTLLHQIPLPSSQQRSLL
eukprot:TRINITY_DN4957_c0_g1_i1.p1 TRINITY_DN4957_c0_g1~~TRINITY_DN4957_c0_g1_i1.p1  ORF type:complete len:305 (-),score=44.39 TRINITY_DN4957_c0_g1_i1:28-942(-)